MLLRVVKLILVLLILILPVNAQDGAQIYKENCQQCHASDGKGIKEADFTQPSFWKSKTKGDLVGTVKNGKSIMPAYEDKLTEEEIKAVLEYSSDFAGVSYSEIPNFIPVISGFTAILCLIGISTAAIILRRS